MTGNEREIVGVGLCVSLCREVPFVLRVKEVGVFAAIKS